MRNNRNVLSVFFIGRLFFLLPFSLFLSSSSFSQVDVADSVFVYTELEEALKEPDKVYNLDLSKKKLTEFPMEILQFKNLRTLKLVKNKIDSIPDAIGELKNLREIDFSRNKLVKIGKGICELTNLEKMNLSQNSIEAFPPEIKNLKKLKVADMWDNNLGTFPEELAELADTLKELDLRNISYTNREQEYILSLLPKTKIHMSPSCNCKD